MDSLSPDAANAATAPMTEVVAPGHSADEHGHMGLRVTEALQTILTALILAFVFRAFFVEAFIIPTGSMAEGLLGLHSRFTCAACGVGFPVSLSTSSPYTRDVICPNCRHRWEASPATLPPRSGDRIFVHKWISELGAFFPLNRWDVFVFRDPENPSGPGDGEQNYIKRLIGLPGDTVEIIRGDVFINGRVSLKSPVAQSALWIPVFDQSYVPVDDPDADLASRWLENVDAIERLPHWKGLNSRIAEFDGDDGTASSIEFQPYVDRDYLLDFVAYNRRSSGEVVTDVRIGADVEWRSAASAITLEVSRDRERVAARIDRSGSVQVRRLADESAGEWKTMYEGQFRTRPMERFIPVEFAYVDFQLVCRVNGRTVWSGPAEGELPSADAVRARPAIRNVGIRITGECGRFSLHRLRIDRDVYYTCSPGRTERAGTGSPFVLREGEYFAMGDNSADSHDSREWTDRGLHLPESYRVGTVPGDQIVGRAAFVYLPSVLPITGGGHVFVPDVGRIRFIR